MVEYKVITVKVRDAEQELNRLALDGWRVVGTALNSGVSPVTRLAPMVITLERKTGTL